jgi:general secretion pathway protein K
MPVPLNFPNVRSTGVALIIVLLVVALATITAVAMTARQQLDIYRTANLLNHEQAYLYALGGESWAKWILWRDNKESQTDNLHELWATHLPPLPILGGTLQGSIEDLQGRFNVNNLVQDGKTSPEDLIRFQRLLKVLDLSPTLAQVVVDWIDNDTEPQSPDGAEDNTYLLQTPAYRTANTSLSSPTELRLLAGFDQDTYQKLLPYICTLPTHTLINVNTASLPVLRTIVEGLNEVDANRLITDRDNKPFDTTQAFLIHDALAGLKVDAKSISVSSDYFLFTAQVEIDKARAQLSSILYRSPEQVIVIMRSQELPDYRN